MDNKLRAFKSKLKYDKQKAIKSNSLMRNCMKRDKNVVCLCILSIKDNFVLYMKADINQVLYMLLYFRWPTIDFYIKYINRSIILDTNVKSCFNAKIQL